MSLFIFQNSRRQLLSHLLLTVKTARAHRASHLKSGTPESAAEKRRIDSLIKAIRAADEQIRNLEFWSDVKHVEKGKKGEEKIRLNRGTSSSGEGVEGEFVEVEDITPGLKGGTELGWKSPTSPVDIGEDIKGIPDEAELENEGLKAIFDSGGPDREVERGYVSSDENVKVEREKGKGKGKAKAEDTEGGNGVDSDDMPVIDISID
jgi:hypothetical protein